MFVAHVFADQKPFNGSRLLGLMKKNPLAYQSLAMLLLSLSAFAVNHLFYHYPGNLYWPPGGVLMILNALLFYVGFFLWQGRDGRMTQIAKDMIYYVSFLGLVVLATNAVQYTPFPAIDQHILAFELWLHVDTRACMMWAHEKPSFIAVLEWVYASLTDQLRYIPLMVILARRTALIREYYSLLLITALIGFTFYYFFPTTAPASVMDSVYFSEEQRATAVKFFQLHHYIQPQSINGGLIALPSFHVIWAFLCLRLVRAWPVVFWTLLPINLLLVCACVLLGWHYCVDILGSVVVISLALVLQRPQRLFAFFMTLRK